MGIDFNKFIDEGLELSLMLNADIIKYHKDKRAESVSSATLAVALNLIMKAYIAQAPLDVRLELLSAVNRDMLEEPDGRKSADDPPPKNTFN